MKTRTFILNGSNNKNILTGVMVMTGESDIECNMRLYNCKETKQVCIVLKIDDKTYIQHNFMLNEIIKFEISNANIEGEISIVVFDKNGENVIVSYNANEKIVNELKDNIQADNRETKGDSNTAQISTVYNNENSSIDIGEGDVVKEGGTFFDMISTQFEEMFLNNPHCLEVETLIPNSQWVSVEWDNMDTKENYILGKIFDNNELSYVCYGVYTDNKDSTSGIDMRYAQWLPLDVNEEAGEGYYIMYQDAKTGENVKI